MKRPTEPGWYWLKRPGEQREVVWIEHTDSTGGKWYDRNFIGIWSVHGGLYWGQNLNDYDGYVDEPTGWRWLGRAVMEQKSSDSGLIGGGQIMYPKR